jgi:PAS domain S-box-containing protein
MNSRRLVKALITDVRRLRLEKTTALKDLEALHRLIANATDLLTTTDVEGRMTYVGPAVQPVLGYTPRELLGRSVFEHVHPDDIDGVRSTFQNAVGAGKPSRATYRYRRKDGVWRTLESLGQPLVEGGEVVGGIINSRDITERTVAEQALSEEAAFRKAIEDSVQAGIIATDGDGRINYVNRAFEELVGWRAEELIGRTMPMPYWPPEDIAERTRVFSRMLAGEFPRDAFEARYMRRDGSRFDVLVIASPLTVGGRRGSLAAFYDVTERKRLEAQFRQAQKMEAIGRLAGGVAHDFNNLLTAIIGYSDLALQALSPDDPLADDIEEIRRAGESAASLTRQMLAFSRHQVMQPTVVNLNTVVHEMTRMLGRVIGEDIQLVAALDPDIALVKADRGQIEQVLMNLAVNARDAMPSGGRLVIQTRNVNAAADLPLAVGLPPQQYVALAVSDTGVGIPEEARPYIFDPFFTTKERGRGTGLGLATVYGIIHQSGGHIGFDTGVGKGTSFTMFLPPCEAPECVEADAHGPVERRGTETILLAEDDDGIRGLTERLLKRQGYTVLGAASAEDALAIMERRGRPVDLLLTDVVMPGLSGPELARQLAQRTPALKCLFISGYAEEAQDSRRLLDRDVPFLQKPFKAAALLKTVRDVLDTPHASVLIEPLS